MKNKIKEMVKNGKKPIGSFHNSGSTAIVEAMAYSGLDYILFDNEHGPFDVDTTQDLIRTANNLGTTSFVRTEDGKRNSILKALDVGAHGLIIPNVYTVAEVQDIVRFGKYYPLGSRGFGSTSANRFLSHPLLGEGIDTYFNVSNEETLIIPQCETKEMLENIDEIVALAGVDGVFVGPYDLSIALDVPGEVSHPKVIAACEKVIAACRRENKLSFIFSNSIEDLKEKLALGFDSVTFGIEINLVLQAYKDVLEQCRDLQ